MRYLTILFIAAALSMNAQIPAGTGIMHMIEEEKLAYDVYVTLYEEWGLKVFSNISQSEFRHFNAMKGLAEEYGVAYTDSGRGMYDNDDFETLYQEIVSKGTASKEEALQVGALIEDLDIYDLDEYLEMELDENTRAVYENLLSGSENHMRAFTKQLGKYGVEYAPEYISAERYAEIISQ